MPTTSDPGTSREDPLRMKQLQRGLEQLSVQGKWPDVSFAATRELALPLAA